MRLGLTLTIPLIVSVLCGCRIHRVDRCPTPCTEVPESFSQKGGQNLNCEPWWKEFNDPSLNKIMEELFCSNLELQQVWNRLLQAKASYCIAASAFIPQVTLGSDIAQISQKGGGGIGVPAGGGIDLGVGGQGGSNFTLNGLLNYEVDIWRKIDSTVKSACENFKATKEDLDATALTLSRAATEFWLTIKQQEELLNLLKTQIHTSRTQLELVELRYSVGESGGLTVHQQRLQLAATESDVPPLRQLYQTSVTGLQVLLGKAPVHPLEFEVTPLTENLPPKPNLGTPWELVQARPDLKAAFHRIREADYEVGVAIADRFPTLKLSMLTELSSFNFNKLFNGELYAIIAEVAAPIVDGGRRRCEVERRRAILWERVNFFGDLFLNAIKEVEDAFALEREQEKLLELLHIQESAARYAFTDSQWRYMSGQTNYLDVITALQSLQNVERLLVVEKKNLWSFRANLYQALGGGFEICGGI